MLLTDTIQEHPAKEQHGLRAAKTRLEAVGRNFLYDQYG